MQAFHIIGTDTDIGKTYTCCELLNYLALRNYKCTAFKPIASGIITDGNKKTNNIIINHDVAKLIDASNYKLPASIVNPFLFHEAIAPHLASKMQHIELNADIVAQTITMNLKNNKADYIFIEGAGGVMLPLNNNETYLDILNKLHQPIILVVGMKLGCLNHALLTENVLLTRKLPLVGWIANQINSQMKYYQNNISYLQSVLTVPLLATISSNGKLNPNTNFKKILQCY